MHVWRRKLPSVGNVAPALVELEQWLVGELAKAGNLRPDQIDPRSPLAHYSLDSLKLTELAGQIEDRLHIHLPVETVIGTTSLAELVMKLQDLLLEKTSSKPAQALVKPSPTSHEASADSEMQSNEEYSGGENFCLHQILLKGRNLKLKERAASVQAFVDRLYEHREQFHMRLVMSPSDREVLVMDPYTHQPRSMRMFGSNDYLGLANHPEVIAAASCALREYGAGIGGPPLFNGYTALHRQFEERLALLKGTEDALIFSSGYAANVGLATGLFNATDVVLYDAYSHASFIDGIKMSGVSAAQFPHNDIESLGRLIATHRRKARGDIFVGVEGVYSMDGDLAPLDEIVQLCRASGAILLVDDAHGTGVMGATGKGTAEHFNIEGQVDITMGTFSKTFAVSGGFIAATKPIVSVLRFFARSYMFSASLPPVGVATVLAGLDVLERHPHLVVRLRENVRYTAQRLRELGFDVNPQAAIISLRVPEWMNIRQAAYKFHERGIFVNSVEFPAVPLAQQRFRISLMATHTHNDIDRLLSVVAAVWAEAKSEQPRVSVDSNT
jgi:glycine C-acetyltransferase